MKLSTLAAGVCLPVAFALFAGFETVHAQVEAPAASPIQKIGSEFQANQIVKYSQIEPSVAGLSDGNFVVAWQDDSGTPPDTNSYAVRARIFKPNGIVITPTEFLVPNRFGYTQSQAQAVGLKDRFVIGWSDDGWNGGDQEGYAIRNRHLANDGTPSGKQTTVNQITGGDQWQPAMAAIPTGGYIAAWFDGCRCDGDGDYQVRAQVFDENGKRVGKSFRAADIPNGTQQFAAVAGLPNGESVVVWEDWNFLTFEKDPDIGSVIRGQRIGPKGKKKGKNFLVNTTIRGSQSKPGVASIGDGSRYVVVWEDNTGSAATPAFDTNIRAQVRGAKGKVGKEFVVNTTTAGEQRYPKVLGLSDDKFLVCWVDLSQTAPDFSGNSIRCQAFTMSGKQVGKYGPEFVANGRKTNDQGNEYGFQGGYSIARLKSGDVAVVWEDWSGSAPDRESAGIRGQVYRIN